METAAAAAAAAAAEAATTTFTCMGSQEVNLRSNSDVTPDIGHVAVRGARHGVSELQPRSRGERRGGLVRQMTGVVVRRLCMVRTDRVTGRYRAARAIGVVIIKVAVEFAVDLVSQSLGWWY